MTPAVLRALAYYRITGSFPSHIHLNTWSAAYRLLDCIPHVVCGVDVGRNVLNNEAVAATESEPMWMAAKYLMDRGFKVRKSCRAGKRTSHYIPFYDAATDSERTALVHRGGGGSITTPIFTEGSDVFIRNETTYFSVEDTKGDGQ